VADWKDKAVAATRGTKTGAILRCALGVASEPGEAFFTGKASVTSDGFVMCNFTGVNGEHHMGAFVGDVSQLNANVEGLARHLKLNAADKAELLDVIQQWIGIDYRAKGAAR
jgi:hypothetical protein